VRRFPILLDAIASGRVHLSSIVLLRDHFTDDNIDDLLDRAAGKSKREIEELVARLAPKADVPSLMRKLPDRVEMTAPPQAAPRAVRQPPKPQVQPLSETRYRVQLTASAALRDKLEHARRLMSHSNPAGDLAAVVEEAIDLLIEKLEKAKLGKTDRPRAATKPPKDPGNVTRAARREVFERDGLRCSFVGKDGERCTSCELLELDHRTPRAYGGTGDATNIRVLCKAHNLYEAEQAFGRARIDVYRCKPAVETRDRVRGALRAMGFRSAEAERAVNALDAHGWDGRPIETLVRDAIGVIT
jgi:hypothetical protein